MHQEIKDLEPKENNQTLNQDDINNFIKDKIKNSSLGEIIKLKQYVESGNLKLLEEFCRDSISSSEKLEKILEDNKQTIDQQTNINKSKSLGSYDRGELLLKLKNIHSEFQNSKDKSTPLMGKIIDKMNESSKKEIKETEAPKTKIMKKVLAEIDSWKDPEDCYDLVSLAYNPNKIYKEYRDSLLTELTSSNKNILYLAKYFANNSINSETISILEREINNSNLSENKKNNILQSLNWCKNKAINPSGLNEDEKLQLSFEQKFNCMKKAEIFLKEYQTAKVQQLMSEVYQDENDQIIQTKSSEQNLIIEKSEKKELVELKEQPTIRYI